MTAGAVLDPALMAAVVRDTMESREYDAALLCVNLIWRQGKPLAEHLARARQDCGEMLSVAWIAGMPEPVEQLDSSGVPVFADPVRCARAIAARLWWEAGRDAVSTAERPAAAFSSGKAEVGSFRAEQALLGHYGIAQAPGVLATSLDEARSAAGALGYPVVAKLVAKSLAHKSDAGGVVLNIASQEELDAAFSALLRIEVPAREGVLVQKMLSAGCELFAGFKRDAAFGPIVVFGLGGIYVEVLRETLMKLAPFDAAKAADLIRSARFFPLLDGARGRKPCDVGALAGMLSRLSILAIEQPHIESVDLNPILVTEDGATVLDAKVET
jgi:acyl-CoA synthetase (NDP forming)